MEILTEQTIDGERKRFLLIEVDRPCQVAEKLENTSPHFALLTAMNLESETDEALLTSAEKLLDLGLAYLCAWGSDCERWHDCVDTRDVERMQRRPVSSADVVMTTWHADEPLEDALFFIRYCAVPSGLYATEFRDCVIAAHPSFVPRIRTYFRSKE